MDNKGSRGANWPYGAKVNFVAKHLLAVQIYLSSAPVDKQLTWTS